MRPMPLVSISFKTFVDGGDSDGSEFGGIYDEYTIFAILLVIYYKQ